jgi:ubiquinone/menaquinone biosynthesis C-methylase UbiE
MATCRQVYAATSSSGESLGVVGARDLARFRDTQRLLIPDAQSLLDVGCFYGEWLSFLRLHPKSPTRLVGIDVADNKIARGLELHQDLDLRVGTAEELGFRSAEFDIVTCLEVLEHIPDWRSVLDRLVTIGGRQVLLTVPFQETIIETVCVHCARVTPLYGHLHRFTEESFPEYAGWRRTWGTIRDRDPSRPLAVRLYRLWRPRYAWMYVSYSR